MEAQGSVMTNKYAEGYPGKRYYGGCEHVDIVEQLAIDRAKELFGAHYANVQPHQALKLTLLSTWLWQTGRHAPGHESRAWWSPDPRRFGELFRQSIQGRPIRSGRNHGEIDYAGMRALAEEHQPKIIVAGFSAYSRVVDWQKFRDAADAVGAYLVVDMAHVAGWLPQVTIQTSPNCRRHNFYYSQDASRRRGGIILARQNETVEKRLNSLVFPGTQGGPLPKL